MVFRLKPGLKSPGDEIGVLCEVLESADKGGNWVCSCGGGVGRL